MSAPRRHRHCICESVYLAIGPPKASEFSERYRRCRPSRCTTDGSSLSSDSTFRIAFLPPMQYRPLTPAGFGSAPVDVAMLTRLLIYQVRPAAEGTAYVRAKRVIFHNCFELEPSQLARQCILDASTLISMPASFLPLTTPALRSKLKGPGWDTLNSRPRPCSARTVPNPHHRRVTHRVSI